jgi:hypothetical protein
MPAIISLSSGFYCRFLVFHYTPLEYACILRVKRANMQAYFVCLYVVCPPELSRIRSLDPLSSALHCPTFSGFQPAFWERSEQICKHAFFACPIRQPGNSVIILVYDSGQMGFSRHALRGIENQSDISNHLAL